LSGNDETMTKVAGQFHVIFGMKVGRRCDPSPFGALDPRSPGERRGARATSALSKRHG
jgi:hypothetical protein